MHPHACFCYQKATLLLLDGPKSDLHQGTHAPGLFALHKPYVSSKLLSLCSL